MQILYCWPLPKKKIFIFSKILISTELDCIDWYLNGRKQSQENSVPFIDVEKFPLGKTLGGEKHGPWLAKNKSKPKVEEIQFFLFH